MDLLFVFIYGLIAGSFINVCIYRIPSGKSIISPPSACPKCKNFIKWYDNIPFLSFILLKGRCRKCGNKISLRYPIVELLTGMLFILFFLKFGLEKTYFFYIIIAGYLITLAFIDIDKQIVPDEIILLMIITGFAAGIFELRQGINIFDGLIGAGAGGFIALCLNYFSNGKMGEGDVKLFAALGLFTGAREITGIMFYAFIIGGVFAAVLLASGKSSRKDPVAFVPFIAAAFILRAFIFH